MTTFRRRPAHGRRHRALRLYPCRRALRLRPRHFPGDPRLAKRVEQAPGFVYDGLAAGRGRPAASIAAARDPPSPALRNLLPRPRSCGERVGVRGCLRQKTVRDGLAAHRVPLTGIAFRFAGCDRPLPASGGARRSPLNLLTTLNRLAVRRRSICRNNACGCCEILRRRGDLPAHRRTPGDDNGSAGAARASPATVPPIRRPAPLDDALHARKARGARRVG